jgi:hypothetical protein
LVCVTLASCATTQALVEAPEEFWITVEKVLLALFQDTQDFLLMVGL